MRITCLVHYCVPSLTKAIVPEQYLEMHVTCPLHYHPHSDGNRKSHSCSVHGNEHRGTCTSTISVHTIFIGNISKSCSFGPFGHKGCTIFNLLIINNEQFLLLYYFISGDILLLANFRLNVFL